MKDAADVYRYQKHLYAAVVLGVCGLGTMLAYMLRSSPYTMFLFMAVGQALILLAIGIYGYTVVCDIRARLASRVQRSFKPEEMIYRQGDPGERVYIITKGEVDVLFAEEDGKEEVVERFRKGDHFGENALLRESPEPREFSARAATRVETITIDRDEFASMYEHVPTVLIQNVVQRRIEQYQDETETAVGGSGEGRDPSR